MINTRTEWQTLARELCNNCIPAHDINKALKLHFVPAALTLGSTAMVTVLPPNSGGYITSSFLPNETAKRNVWKAFTLSTRARATLTNKHNRLSPL